MDTMQLHHRPLLGTHCQICAQPALVGLPALAEYGLGLKSALWECGGSAQDSVRYLVCRVPA